jgi:hypothetical protein
MHGKISKRYKGIKIMNNTPLTINELIKILKQLQKNLPDNTKVYVNHEEEICELTPDTIRVDAPNNKIYFN